MSEGLRKKKTKQPGLQMILWKQDFIMEMMEATRNDGQEPYYVSYHQHDHQEGGEVEAKETD